ncbi:MAG: molybdenum cofactor sulfurase [Hyphomicrobiales bacterium]|nr:MAG: molybdenum cofactor sulfurase [Hyphomicrobiales bacterium]
MIKTIPPKKLKGKVANVLAAKGTDFVSEAVDELVLNYGGIEGDFHAGLTRSSGSREPWYKRGTQMRNERQISILSVEELSEIAPAMGLDELKPEWIGANLVLEGVPNLSYLPPRSLLFFDGGVTLRVDGYNAPCRLAGGSIAIHVGAVGDGEEARATDMALSFKDAAHMKRGLVAWVEREGVIKPGEDFTVRVWEQWVYE